MNCSEEKSLQTKIKFDRKKCHWFMLTFLLPNSQKHCHQGGGPQKEEGVEFFLGGGIINCQIIFGCVFLIFFSLLIKVFL